MLRDHAFTRTGKRQCDRLKGNPCGPLRPNTINVTMPKIQTVQICYKNETEFPGLQKTLERLQCTGYCSR